MTRVTDLAQHNLTQFHLRNAQERIFDTQIQIATGTVADRYSAIGTDAGRLVSLESTQTRIEQYVKNIEIIDQRLQVMETNTSQVFELASTFRTLLINGLNAEASSDLGLALAAQDILQQVAGLLNEQQDGRYLFSGTATNVAPVDLNASGFTAPPPLYPSAADTAYFQGNSTKLSVRVDSNVDVTYGVTADETGFEQIIRALHLASTADVGPPQDRNRFEEALRVVNEALDDIPLIVSRIGGARRTLEQITSKHQEFSLFTEEAIGKIENVDVAEAVSRLTKDQVTLEASYLTVARLAELSLVRFL
jgi:flagellar hook-associated protein 3 FlgL